MLIQIAFLLCFVYSSGIVAWPSPELNDSSSIVDIKKRQSSPNDCLDIDTLQPNPQPLASKTPDGTTADGKPYVNYKWEITEGWVTLFGSCKFMHLINKQWPPPPIVVEKGTVVKLELINKLNNDPISLHVHGLDQKNTQWQDGPVSLTQRGIPPQKKFVYTWDTANEAPGTYWVHNHVSGQYPKGLRTSFIIKSKALMKEEDNWNTATSPTPSNNEWDPTLDAAMTLSDWFSQDWGLLEDLYLNGKCGLGVEVPPRDFLINDVPYGSQTYDFRTTQANPKSGRLRIINMSAFTTFFVYMAPLDPIGRSDLKLQVVEVDGVLTNGKGSYQVVEVAPGQRLSVLVDPTGFAAANPQTYKMFVTINPYEFRHIQAKAKTPNSGVSPSCYQGPESADTLLKTVPRHSVDIRLGATTSTPGARIGVYDKYKVIQGPPARLCFLGIDGRDCSGNDAAYPISTNFIDFDDVKLEPLNSGSYNIPSNGVPRFIVETYENTGGDRRANLRVIHNGNQDWLSNSQHYGAFTPQEAPALELIRQGKKTYEDFAAWGHELIVPDGYSEYIIALYSWTGTHPIHLHGHKFRVLHRERQQSASGGFILDNRLRNIFTFNQLNQNQNLLDQNNNPVTLPSNPLMRDTLTIYKFGLVVLHVVADNPGAWFLHCHNDFHAWTGMSSMVIERPDAAKNYLNTLTGDQLEDYRKCVNYNAFSNWNA